MLELRVLMVGRLGADTEVPRIGAQLRDLLQRQTDFEITVEVVDGNEVLYRGPAPADGPSTDEVAEPGAVPNRIY